MKNNNTGKNNSGNRNSGYWNSGDGNSGYWNSGNGNSGYWNSGYWNTGYWNSGDWNSGDGNSGDWNSGNRNSGYGNSGDRETGLFNTTEGTIRCFNKPTNLTYSEIDHPHFNEFHLCKWIDEEDMTDEEKVAEPEFHVRGGYLKKFEYKEAWKNFWEDTDKKNKEKFLALPNFDADIFFEITGVRVGEDNKKQELLSKADELIAKAEELKEQANNL